MDLPVKKLILFGILFTVLLPVLYYSSQPEEVSDNRVESGRLAREGSLVSNEDRADTRSGEVVEKFQRATPREWGEQVSRVYKRLDTDQRVVVLTLDACDRGYDQELLKYLIEEEIPATIFTSGMWLDEFSAVAAELSQTELFTIENHGWQHKPCSVSGRYAYGVGGTESAGEVFEEIERNNLLIEEITGRRPKFYRSGTAHYDEVCTALAQKLDLKVAGFGIAGDGGATFKSEQIKKELGRAEPGSIILLHMNRPESGVAEGVELGVEELKERGYEFVRLSDYDLIY